MPSKDRWEHRGMMDRAEIRETLDKADELVTELKAFRNLSPDSGNVTQFTVNAGGIGVWMCVAVRTGPVAT